MKNQLFKRAAAHPDESRRRGELVLRTLPILMIPLVVAFVAGLLLSVTGGLPAPPPGSNAPAPTFPVIPIVVLVIFSIALILLVQLGRTTLSALLLIAVWTLLTTLGALGSSVTSFVPALLLIPICAAGLLIDGLVSMTLAALATILVGSLAWLQTQGIVPPWLDATAREPVPIWLAFSFWTAIFWTIAALTTLLAGNLKRALRESRAHAAALEDLRSQLEVRVAEQTTELVRRAARAEALYEVSRAVTSTLDLAQVLDLISAQAARLLGFDAAVILSNDDQSFMPVGGYGLALSTVRLTGAHDQLLREVQVQGVPVAVELPPLSGGSAALVVPLQYDARPLGVLLLLQAQHQAARSPDDIALAAGFASQAAVAIASAQFLEQAREAAMLEERTRLARDIHDTLAQGLTGIVVLLGAVSRALRAAPEEAARNLELAQHMAREALAEARRSVWNMRAGALARGDLGDALRGLVAHPLKPDITMQFESLGAPWPLATSVESALLRIAQESLVNVTKHTAATQVRVELTYTPEAVSLRIGDNGSGFQQAVLDQHAVALSPWQGFGLLGMRERLALLGGTLELRNSDGAHVIATVPYATAARPAYGGGAVADTLVMSSHKVGGAL